ncbi:hypothetical protein OH76DRAFT_94395 [Lentinus brumalis]|uniref:Uncharacterized protein n=1 Tax=Lentinus brumalis TaxID=2498619 RepID=A0A371CQN3_9APHY|nr:hypothetical protein OH76DRAFT_94395 [Polyporus brumalis]
MRSKYKPRFLSPNKASMYTPRPKHQHRIQVMSTCDICQELAPILAHGLQEIISNRLPQSFMTLARVPRTFLPSRRRPSMRSSTHRLKGSHFASRFASWPFGYIISWNASSHPISSHSPPSLNVVSAHSDSQVLGAPSCSADTTALSLSG